MTTFESLDFLADGSIVADPYPYYRFLHKRRDPVLDRVNDTEVSVGRHGPSEARRHDYDPMSLSRELRALYVDFGAVDA